jgi:hypothetical protein
MTPLDLDGFPSAIYDRLFVEWNRINNQFSSSNSNDLPMFYHNEYSFDFNQFIIDSIHNTIDNSTNYNNPHDCIRFMFEFTSNIDNLFKTHPLNLFVHPDYISLPINMINNDKENRGDDEPSNNVNILGFIGQKYANSSSQLSQYIQDICHKELFLWKNRLSKPKTVINIDIPTPIPIDIDNDIDNDIDIDNDNDVGISNPTTTPIDTPTTNANVIDFNNIFDNALNNIMNFHIDDDDDNRNIIEGDTGNIECYINDFEVQSVD